DERVRWPGEVIHSDMLISCRCQDTNSIEEELQFLGFRRKEFFEAALLMFQHRYVCITKYGKPVWIQFQDLIERFIKRRAGLLRQTINEIGVNALEFQAPRLFE